MLRKKVIALVMGVLMSCSIVGCGSESSTEAAKTENEAAKTENVGVESSTEASDTEASEERETLTIWSCWTNSSVVSDPGDNYFFQAIEEACNVDLEFVNSAGGKEALSILTGTGDLPDLIYDWDYNIPDGLQGSLNNGSIIALNDLIDQGKMPNFTAYLATDSEADKLIKNDEGLYAWAPMIRKQDAPTVFAGNLIRQDWLDELGLEMPTTMDEVENVLRAFKEQKGADAALAFAWGGYNSYAQVYGVCEDFYIDADGKVKYGFIEDGYKDFLTKFNSWYAEGLIDPDAFTQDIDTFYAKMATDRNGIVYGFTGSTFGQIEIMKEENPDINYVAMPYPSLEEGGTFPVDISAYRVNNIGIMISSKCEKLDAAARVIDYLYSEEGTMLCNYGQEGVSYEMVDGEPVLTELVTNDPNGLSIQNALAFYAGTSNKPHLLERSAAMQTYALDVQKDSLEVWATPDAKIKLMPSLSMTAEETEEFNTIMTDISTYVSEMKLRFIMGTKSIDDFDKFVEDIKSMNIERAIEIKQAAYDRYLTR